MGRVEMVGSGRWSVRRGKRGCGGGGAGPDEDDADFVASEERGQG